MIPIFTLLAIHMFYVKYKSNTLITIDFEDLDKVFNKALSTNS